MRILIHGALVLALLVLVSTAASADFIDRGGGMVYDDVLDITWLQDFNHAETSNYDADGFMTWSAANTWAAGLTVGGATDWRLPTFDPDNARPATPTLENEIGSLWSQLIDGAPSPLDISPFTNLDLSGDSQWYWTGLEDEDDSTSAWRYSMECG